MEELRAVWKHRRLLGQLVWRGIEGRYRSSVLGLGWSLLTPLFTLALYTYVFGVVFRTRWPGTVTDSVAEYGLLLFAGMVTFGLFGETINTAPSTITAVPNYVKKVIFPLEILPVVAVATAAFNAAIGLALLAVARFVILGPEGAMTLWLVPVMLVPVALLAFGLAWLLASLGVFLRDIAHAVGMVTQLLFFTTPVLYPREVVPPSLQWLLAWNPLTSAVENTRRVAIRGQWPDWSAWAIALLIGIVVMVAGASWFGRTKRAFADVL